MSEPTLSIIIVNWNSADYVLSCIKCIRAQTSSVTYEIIVVDNASFDGCDDRLIREYPDVNFLQSQVNLGFGRANNFGASQATGDVLLFLNPDTEVQDHAIDVLYTHFRKLPSPGVVGCRLLNSDGSLQSSCVQPLPTVLNQVLTTESFQRLFPRVPLWRSATLFEGLSSPAEVEALLGACMMIRKDVFSLVGGFSPDYFMYGEDLDLCFKTRRAGFHNYHVNDAAIVHHGGGSTNQSLSNFSNVMMRESVYRFLRKSRGGLYSRCYRAAMCAAATIRITLLGILFPAWCARGNVGRWSGAFRKWFGVLRWGLGLERWTRQYESAERGGACSDEGVK